jgi:hypothetical protein
MKSGKISISSNGNVYLPDNVQMRPFEIAALFSVYLQTINSNIKTLLKSGTIKANSSDTVSVDGDVLLPDFYGLDMIIALAFRLHSPEAELFRKWVIRKITANPLPTKLIIQLSNRALFN